MTRKQKGIFLIILPFIIVGIVLLSFVIINTLLQASVPTGISSTFELIPQALAQESFNGNIVPEEIVMATRGEDSLIDLIRSMTNYFLGFLGIFTIFGSIFLFWPLGIYYIVTADHKATYLLKDPDFAGLRNEELESIDRLSWGAFFGGFIWPLSTGLYLWAFLSLIPFVNIYAFFKLWIHGRKMSWKALKMKNFEDFQQRQMVPIYIIIGINVLAIVGLYFGVTQQFL